METKRLITVMLLGMLVILAWPHVMTFVGTRLGYDMTPRPAATQPADAPLTAAMPGNASMTTPVATPATAATTTNLGGFSVSPIATTQPVAGVDASGIVKLGSIANDDPNYPLELTISPNGAGLEQAALNAYQLDLRSQDRFTFQKPAAGVEELTRPLAIRGVTINGVDVDLTGRAWTPIAVSREPGNGYESVTYALQVAGPDGGIELRRTWTVLQRDTGAWEDNGKRYDPLGLEPKVDTTVRNLGSNPVQVAIRFNAPAVPPSESERLLDTQYITGYASEGVVAPDSPWTVDGIREPTDLLASRKDRQPYWFGTGTTYFMSLFRFDPNPGTQTPIDWFASIPAKTLTPDKYGKDRANEVVIVTKPMTVAGSSEATIAAHIYLGPKKREILTNAYYTAPWVQYDRGLIITNWFCGICTWQWLIDVLFSLLKVFHFLLRDWGLAIICLTFLVRLALHPITKRAQMNMLKFGKLAPEMTKIKERYKDDQEEMNRQMMAFYREHGGTQLMGCLPMFLQMPVWIALWQAMNSTFELWHQPFFYGWTWISDLSKPDHLIDFAEYGWKPYHLPLLSFVTISGLNILPFIYGVLQWLQMKIQPKPPSMTPEQEQQQKTMQIMMLVMMPVILYASPSGLMIYMITSFLLGIIESKLVKRQFEAQSANEAKFEIIDGDAPRPANVQKASVRRKDEPKKKGLMAMLQEARERAAQMQQEMEKQRRNRK